jgi:hypothetical protein
MRESIEIEWTAHVPATNRPRRRWPWELLPALIVVLLPLTTVNTARARPQRETPQGYGSAAAEGCWVADLCQHPSAEARASIGCAQPGL